MAPPAASVVGAGVVAGRPVEEGPVLFVHGPVRGEGGAAVAGAFADGESFQPRGARRIEPDHEVKTAGQWIAPAVERA
jgi:hypothetical protein